MPETLDQLKSALSDRHILEKARVAIGALSLDPGMPKAHATRGYMLMFSDYAWAEAEREFRSAIAGAPNEASIRSQYASFLGIVGRFDQSVREAYLALSLDPESPAMLQSASTMLLGARMYDSALVMARRSIALEPNNQITWNARWQSAWYSNHFDEAFEAIVGLQNAAGFHAVGVAELKAAFASGGKPGVVRLLLAKWPQGFRPAYRALWYAELGDRDAAMERLERGYDEKWISLPYVLRWQSFDGMRSDPRFIAFMKKIGLPPAA